MTDFQTFELERFMSLYEQTVDFNLSESGVHPVVLSELLDNDPKLIEELLETDLNYPHVNGVPELRQNIARLYESATADNVLVTIGAIEANYIAVRSLLSTGDEIVIMTPNYMQIWGIAKNHGLRVKTFPLIEENGWAPDLDALAAAVTGETKMIAICNPNNPTGRAMTVDELDAVIDIARSVGAWLLADEVYSGAERESEEETVRLFGRYEKAISIGSMSKAYGLPGLRTGWVVAPQTVIDVLWERHEYLTISSTMLGNKLSAQALSPEVRPRLLARTRSYIRDGFEIFSQWLDDHPGLFSLVPPDAAAIAFVRYHLDVNSTELVHRLMAEKNVLLVPGDQFGLDHHLRISFGLPPAYLTEALDRTHDLLTNYM